MRCRHYTAFTLIELLTVIAVLAILSLLLIPVINGVRKRADMASGVERLRALGGAFSLYLNEHDLYFPMQGGSGQRWPIHIMSYIGPWDVAYNSQGVMTGAVGGNPVTDQVYQSPLFRDPTQEGQPGGQGTFAYNMRLNSPNKIHISMLSNPSTFPVLATSQGNVGGGFNMAAAGPSPAARQYGYTGTTNNGGPAPNYGRNALFLFGDWHVEARDVCDGGKWPWSESDAFDVK